MKKVVSALLVMIIACSSLSACSRKQNKDAINSVFYDSKSTMTFCKRKGYKDNSKCNDYLAELEEKYDLTFDPLNELSSEEKEHNRVAGEKIRDEITDYVDGRLVYGEFNDGIHIMNADGFYYGRVSSFHPGVEASGQELEIVISARENYNLPSEYEDLDEYFKYYYHNNYATSLSGNNITTTSENVLIGCKYNDTRNCVLLMHYDSKSGTLVIITYYIPTEDDSDDIEILRELGIPVYTDYFN